MGEKLKQTTGSPGTGFEELGYCGGGGGMAMEEWASYHYPHLNLTVRFKNMRKAELDLLIKIAREGKIPAEEFTYEVHCGKRILYRTIQEIANAFLDPVNSKF